MFRLGGIEQRYAWGTVDVIPALLGREPDGEPIAEYWYGAHPLGDSPIDGDGTLSTKVAQHTELLGEATASAFGGRLPYLVKFLSAASPLSLQAHPSRPQAVQGYARESLLGIPTNAPERSFRDDWPKPETIIALTPFEGLLGFRPPKVSAQLFEALGVGDKLASVIGPLRDRATTPALQEVFLDVLSLGERRHLVDEVLAAAVRLLDAPGELGVFAQTAVELDEHFPGDPGILAALLLNRFRLEPGQAVSLEAGIMHAYLKGTGVEVMANSDNVLRGGLTRKHIDVDALLHVVKFEPTPVKILTAEGSDGLYLFPSAVEEFEVWMVQPVGPSVEIPRADSGRILLVSEGSFTLHGDGEPLHLRRGQAVFAPAGEQVMASGQGQLFAVASGV
ncbi:mannose-6-phosphate isomerase, class I [Tessaracoccus sp. OS52]|uniref:mannose-6-phosphate isomerase, class I n=1 Tax=Tessaracoccus sp. OS52 TaxID=2886691 RepID=UPI001D10D6E5|nr:mannose-6-phosphate isomerase, class I [Tessaracoccus sp. OS52]MCC2591992.1 mannose-6-phosphate isomerase, class I [Tessaracoccus sp. OS52]